MWLPSFLLSPRWLGLRKVLCNLLAGDFIFLGAILALNPHQQFIKKNFEVHARVIAQEAASRKDSTQHAVYISIMTMLSTAFQQNKIIIKNCPEWDLIEQSKE